jgi:hypothetical protein
MFSSICLEVGVNPNENWFWCPLQYWFRFSPKRVKWVRIKWGPLLVHFWFWPVPLGMQYNNMKEQSWKIGYMLE